MKMIDTKNAPAAIGPYSQAMVVNGFVYTSGQIPINPATGAIETQDLKEQAEQVIQQRPALIPCGGQRVAAPLRGHEERTSPG